MKFLSRILFIICASFSLYSCVESTALDIEDVETLALQSWIEINRPDLLENYQVNGGYYVELLDEGVADSAAVRYDDSWVWFDVTCRDLSGNVAMTRNSELARMQNVYTDHTHYVPYYLYCGESKANSLPEGIYLSMRNQLKIGDRDISVRYGTKLRLYMPSSLVSDTGNGMTGDGGYQGQYSLDRGRPMIAEVRVWGHVGNPLAYEDQWVRSFAQANGGLAPEPEDKESAAAASALRRSFKRDTRGEGEGATTVYDNLWYPAVDSIAGLYINYMYTPKTQLNFDCLRADTLIYEGQTAYAKGKIFGTKSLAQINKEIDDALLKRFGEGIDPAEADSLGAVQTANIWYVTRLLDGFVVDTNITEVQKIVYANDYDDIYDTSSALSFITAEESSDDNSYVDAWKYAIPQMKLGAWNVILTTSSNAYGAIGVAGSSSSSSSSSYSDYYNYYNYYNSYYGNSYYNNYYNNYYGMGGMGMGMGGMGMGGMYGGGMYGGMYGGYDYYNNYYNSYYYNNYYNNSYYTDSSNDDVAITTTSEVLPYTPLLWQVYIEPAK